MIPQIINQKVWLYDTTYGDWQTAKSVGRLIWKTDKTDYRKYATVEEYKKAYKQEDNPSTNGSYLNALYSIFSPMHKGDIIIAREGLHDIVAWGEVMSDYMYDKENADYQSYRDVRWHFLGNIPVELKEKGVWFYEISADIYEPLFEKIEFRYNQCQSILDQFLSLHNVNPFNGNEEKYKWEIFSKCSVMTDELEIAKQLTSNDCNFIYHREVMTLNRLLKQRPQEIKQIICDLYAEQKPLRNRIQKFNSDISSLCEKGQTKPTNERTAAAFLSVRFPNKYTLFVKTELYKPLCEHLKLNMQNNAYQHYLELICPISELIENSEIVNSIFQQYETTQFDTKLLKAQTILWCIRNNWQNKKSNNMEELIRFKHLLEYFVAHLNYVQSDTTNFEGYDAYIKPLVDSKTFYSAGQGWKDHAIQKQVSAWDTYSNGKMCININQSFGNYTSRSTYINWEGTGLNIIAKWKSNMVTALMLTNFSKDDDGESNWTKPDFKYTLEDLELYKGENVINKNITDLFNEFNRRKQVLDMERKENAKKEKYNEYIRLLQSNYNLILSGAPGTGKTYLAKEIAKAMGADEESIKMVQFHPSYDYTDFVEGLRPIIDENGQSAFERVDGVFKKFCKVALKNLQESKKDTQTLTEELNESAVLDEMISSFIVEDGDTDIKVLKLEKSKNQFYIIGQDEKSIRVSIPNNTVVKQLRLRKQELLSLYRYKEGMIESVKDVKRILNRNFGMQDDSYLLVLYKELKKFEKHYVSEVKQQNKVERKNFVFIIDEINRGEMSKIFGELFYSIDSGYRGTAGQVFTQYANMANEPNEFDTELGTFEFGHFFVPENVYIIGTMNDIDRSVETMDFAMRRRFAWKEVTAEDSYRNIIEQSSRFDDDTKIEIKKRMTSINAIIEQELGSEYQIGAAYFLKLKDNGIDYEGLWKNHLYGLLYEYFRGERKDVINEKLQKLKDAYDGAATDTDSGQ